MDVILKDQPILAGIKGLSENQDLVLGRQGGGGIVNLLHHIL